MLGTASETRWGVLPLVVDTSAWMRRQHPMVRERWQETHLLGQFRLSPLVCLEVLFTAKDITAFEEWTRLLAAVWPVSVTASMLRAAESAMRDLAGGSAGAHRIPIVDYFVAAAAESVGGAVLHYDRDFDRLAEVMEFESIWLAPPGSIP
jgi:predicted nucleic acid-binding protein